MSQKFLVPIQLPADPTNPLEAATKQYVDATTRQVIASVAGTSYSVQASDENKLYAFSSATAVTLTVFTNASVPIPVGYRLDLAQMGAGKVTVAASGGVTITATPSLGLRAQGSAASLIKVGTDAWLLTGDLA